MSFASPDLLWLIALAPTFGLLSYLLWSRRLSATEAWASRALWQRLTPRLRKSRLVLTVSFVLLSVVGITLGLARPRWGVIEQEVEQRGIDLVIVIDSSLSMSAVDLHPDRLTAAKILVRELLGQVPQHRVGLVQAEGDGVVLAPLTLDHGIVSLLLDSVEVGTLPTPGTQLAAGLERAFALFPSVEESQPVVIVVSDGEDHDANWDNLVDHIRENDIRIHTLGVGTLGGSPMPLAGSDQPRYKADRAGKTIITRLQADLLKKLSEAGQGVYIEANSAGSSISPIVEALEEVRAKTLASETITQERERFQWFLAAAALCLFAGLFLSPFSRSSKERL